MAFRLVSVGLGLAGILVLGACSGGDTGTPGADRSGMTPVPDSIRRELIALGEADQEPRRGLTPEAMQDTAFLQRMLRGDSARSARLMEITAAYGWPDPARVGPEAAQAAFLILQHSPYHDFQREMLPVLEESARSGHLPSDDVAMLVDRVLTNEGLPQRYGTRFTLVDGRWVMDPVDDAAGLDQRRAAVGLPDLEEYMRKMEEFTRAPVVRSR